MLDEKRDFNAVVAKLRERRRNMAVVGQGDDRAGKPIYRTSEWNSQGKVTSVGLG